MKRCLLLVLPVSLLACASLSFAQFTITQGNMPAFGTLHTFYGTQEDVTLNVGSSGANQTWTAPQVDAPLTGSNELVQPNTTPFSSSFPTATHAFRSMDADGLGEGYSYTRLTSGGAYSLGMATGAAGQEILIVYDDESLDIPFPATYGTEWTSLNHYSSEPLPGVTITSTDSTIHHIDGWGTLNNQFGTFSVLRIFSHSFITNVTDFPPFPPTTTETSFYYYEWITQSGIPAMTMWSNMDETEPEFTLGGVSFAIAGPVSTDPIRGPIASSFTVGQNYPNPFNPTTSLPISLENAGNVEITIYNELGEVISSEVRTFGPGNHTVGFDGSAWASGNYFAQVKADGQLQTRRMTLVK